MIPFMACGELLSQARAPAPRPAHIDALAAYLAGAPDPTGTLKAPTFGGTSTQHVHSLHKYKAKFFPRLIRSFLVEYLDAVPRDRNGQVTLLDPFVGSGTALVEASLLGIASVGIDIDALSCAISQAKLDALTMDADEIEAAASELVRVDGPSAGNEFHFPGKIARKFVRWGRPEEQAGYERCITKWKAAIDATRGERIRRLFGICLSDALTRKFVIRMLGTGVGRFALEIAKTPLDALMRANLQAAARSVRVARSLIDGYGIRLGPATVCHGTAVALPFGDDSFSITVTSPPYLPASSGREDYVVGKAIAQVALGLMSDEEIEQAETRSVGSMKWGMEDGDGLPQAVHELEGWLRNDPLREIKAGPTLAYYVSLKRALAENFRVLLPGGAAIYVIGKESVFYRFSTREVLYKVACDEIFADLARSCGFVIEEQVNVELDKKNRNARPRSLDSFYEAVFILRKG